MVDHPSESFYHKEREVHTFKRIIVGVDGSPASVNASRIAFRLGNFYNIPVVGVYVVDVRLLEESFLADLAGVLGFTYYEGISSKVKEFLEKQGDVVLTEFSVLGREFGARVSVVQNIGVPYKEIASQADPEDLIVIGKVGRKPVKGILIGSNSEKVVRHANSPVLMVPQEEREIRNVLVAYDGSENAKIALKICRSLKDVFGYIVKVIHVEEGEDTARGIVEEVRELFGQEIDLISTTGFPEEKIIQTIREDDIDMLFLGAYGKGRFKELFVGSVTSFLIHHIDIPMLLAKAPKD